MFYRNVSYKRNCYNKQPTTSRHPLIMALPRRNQNEIRYFIQQRKLLTIFIQPYLKDESPPESSSASFNHPKMKLEETRKARTGFGNSRGNVAGPASSMIAWVAMRRTKISRTEAAHKTSGEFRPAFFCTRSNIACSLASKIKYFELRQIRFLFIASSLVKQSFFAAQQTNIP